MPHTQNKFSNINWLLWPFFALIFAAILSACAAGPKIKKTDSNKAEVAPQTLPANLSAAPVASITQRLDIKLNVQFDWWKLLRSPQLNTLIEQAFAANPTVEGAQNTLLAAQRSDIIRRGYFDAAIGVSDAGSGQGKLVFVRTPSDLSPSKFIGDAYYNFHTQQLAVGYIPELLRTAGPVGPSKVEAERRQLQMEATYRTLADNLIACALQEASLRAQMVTARKIVAIRLSLLAIARKRLTAGLVMRGEVEAQQLSAERSEQALLIIKGEFEQIHELLRLFIGIPRDANLPENFELTALRLSEELPLELPARLVEQRPDVRAAQLEMLPETAKYQSTVSAALRNEEDTLRAIYNESIELKAAGASEQDNLAALDFSRNQYAAGKADYRDVLAAEQNAQLAVLRLAQARATYLGNAIALYHALGGAWWNDTVSLEIAGELKRR